MKLVDDFATKEDTNVASTEPDVFWRDVASTNGVTRKRTLEEIEIEGLPCVSCETLLQRGARKEWLAG
jgi:hypothetical protein